MNNATTASRIEVSLFVSPVASRACYPVPHRYKAQWVDLSTGGGLVMYTSTVKDTRAEAERLARNWLAKQTPSGNCAPSGYHCVEVSK